MCVALGVALKIKPARRVHCKAIVEHVCEFYLLAYTFQGDRLNCPAHEERQQLKAAEPYRLKQKFFNDAKPALGRVAGNELL